MIVQVQKLQKVNGKAQQWGIFAPRPNVSATVWERVPGFEEYRTARDAILAAATRYSAPSDTFRPIRGRGSTRYQMQMAGGLMPNGDPMTLRDMTRNAPGPNRYGVRGDYRKIDLYRGDGSYMCSTTWAESCREALAHCPGAAKARFA